MTANRRVAIVTGASRGIGQVVAMRLAADGFAVVVNFASSSVSADETVAVIHGKGGQAVAIRGDISDPDQVARLYAGAKEAFGRVDVVVNNAGIMTLAPIADGKLDDFDRTIAINLRATFLMMSRAAEYLRDGGRFIALSTSVLGKNFPGYGAYIASKAGVEGLVRVFANELRGRNITVNATAPGPLTTGLFLNGKTEELIRQIASQSPMERLGQPVDIANSVAFLAGPDGAWVNGQIIRVNGGFA